MAKEKKGSKSGVVAFFAGIGLLCITFGVILIAIVIDPGILKGFVEELFPRQKEVGYAIEIFLLIVMVLIGGGVAAYGHGLIKNS